MYVASVINESGFIEETMRRSDVVCGWWKTLKFQFRTNRMKKWRFWVVQKCFSQYLFATMQGDGAVKGRAFVLFGLHSKFVVAVLEWNRSVKRCLEGFEFRFFTSAFAWNLAKSRWRKIVSRNEVDSRNVICLIRWLRDKRRGKCFEIHLFEAFLLSLYDFGLLANYQKWNTPISVNSSLRIRYIERTYLETPSIQVFSWIFGNSLVKKFRNCFLLEVLIAILRARFEVLTPEKIFFFHLQNVIYVHTYIILVL